MVICDRKLGFSERRDIKLFKYRILVEEIARILMDGQVMHQSKPPFFRHFQADFGLLNFFLNLFGKTQRKEIERNVAKIV